MSCDKKKTFTASLVVRALAPTWLALAALIASPAVLATDSGDIIVVGAKGEVHLLMNGAERKVSAGSVLELPATLRTGRDGSVELKQGATTVSVGPETQLEFPALQKRGAPIDRINQLRGNAFYNIGKREGRKLRVESPYLVGVIKGTQFNVVVDGDSTTVSLFEGLLEVRLPDDTAAVDLRAGEIASRKRDDKAIEIVKMDGVKGSPAAPRARPGSGSNNGTSGPDAPRAIPTPEDAELLRVDRNSVVTPGQVDLGATAPVSPVGNVDVGAPSGASVSSDVDVGTGGAEVPEVAVANAGGSIDVGPGSVDVVASTNVDAVPITTEVSANTNLDAGPGAADVATGANVTVGTLAVDVGAGAGVDLSAGTVETTVSAGVDAGVALPIVQVDVGANVAADVPSVTMDVGLDVAGADLGVSLDLGLDDGNNGNGNDESGSDPSNPGRGSDNKGPGNSNLGDLLDDLVRPRHKK